MYLFIYLLNHSLALSPNSQNHDISRPGGREGVKTQLLPPTCYWTPWGRRPGNTQIHQGCKDHTTVYGGTRKRAILPGGWGPRRFWRRCFCWALRGAGHWTGGQGKEGGQQERAQGEPQQPLLEGGHIGHILGSGVPGTEGGST